MLKPLDPFRFLPLQRFLVLFFIELDPRKVEIAGIASTGESKI